jgi:hypothetical protein|tara:strand:- start:15723 stop:15899 length:177 start_codon:yes stop_codon:yes gene_type:complete
VIHYAAECEIDQATDENLSDPDTINHKKVLTLTVIGVTIRAFFRGYNLPVPFSKRTPE